MKQILTTETLQPRERIEFWRDVVCSTFVELDCDPLCDAPKFHGLIKDTTFGKGKISRVVTAAQHVERSPACLRGSDSDVYLLSLQMTGRGLVRQAGREAWLDPGDFALYDTARTYQLHFDAPLTQLVVRIPRTLMNRYLPFAEHLTASRISGAQGYGRVTRRFLSSVADEIEMMDKVSDDGLLEIFLELLGQSVLERIGRTGTIASTPRATLIARIKEYILDHLTDPELRPPVIAEAHGISPRYLNKLFERERCTVSRWIWRQRLERCRRILADPRYANKTISEIAFLYGYNNMAHFSRTFRDEFNCSPRVYRKNSLRTAVRE